MKWDPEGTEKISTNSRADLEGQLMQLYHCDGV